MEFSLSKTKHKMLVAIEKNVEGLVGEAISKKVMEDGDIITEETDKTKIAEWLKDAMERLHAQRQRL
jgi:phosphohistidine swiveling domain-containing protein